MEKRFNSPPPFPIPRPHSPFPIPYSPFRIRIEFMKIDHTTVAVVTGAASGIGRALAARLAQEGASLAISDINAAELDETAMGLCQWAGHPLKSPRTSSTFRIRDGSRSLRARWSRRTDAPTCSSTTPESGFSAWLSSFRSKTSNG